jgi:hypothetical protein
MSRGLGAKTDGYKYVGPPEHAKAAEEARNKILEAVRCCKMSHIDVRHEERIQPTPT